MPFFQANDPLIYINPLYTFLTSVGMVSLGTIDDITRGALKLRARLLCGLSSPTRNNGVGEEAPLTCFHIFLIKTSIS